MQGAGLIVAVGNQQQATELRDAAREIANEVERRLVGPVQSSMTICVNSEERRSREKTSAKQTIAGDLAIGRLARQLCRDLRNRAERMRSGQVVAVATQHDIARVGGEKRSEQCALAHAASPQTNSVCPLPANARSRRRVSSSRKGSRSSRRIDRQESRLY